MKPFDADQFRRDVLADAERVTDRSRRISDGEDRAHTNGHADASEILPSPKDPSAVARQFIDERFTSDDMMTLRRWRSSWWTWQITQWKEVEDNAVRSRLYAYTERATYLAKDGPAPWSPNRYKITDVTDALAAICLLESDIDQPCWLDDPDRNNLIVSVTNGLLDIKRKQLLAHTPLFFNQTAVPFNYDPNAPEPRRWLDFLGELWPDDPDAIDVLGEWFGYVISGRTDLHKILLMVGPTRGGKGAIARILTALIGGKKNVAGPTLNSLATGFGLQPLIGKSLAIISDARLGSKNADVVVERLLSISGEDAITVDVKYREPWTGRLLSRFHILSNELPKFGDASTAIVGRFVLLLTTRSWLGKEDKTLEPDLNEELSAILNWALAGLERLTSANGNCFTPLPSADEAIIQMRDLASPVAAFVRERCVLGANQTVDKDALYAAFKTWAQDGGHTVKTRETFGRDLRAVAPGVTVVRPRNKEDGDRPRIHVGIGLKQG
jgi:putative DNA primase/helicase